MVVVCVVVGCVLCVILFGVWCGCVVCVIDWFVGCLLELIGIVC